MLKFRVSKLLKSRGKHGVCKWNPWYCVVYQLSAVCIHFAASEVWILALCSIWLSLPNIENIA